MTCAFDEAAAHVHFSNTCFNAAWRLIEKKDRTPAEHERMIALTQASLWHWTWRAECSDRNRSIGDWQASRIRALLGHGDEARRYADPCLAHSDASPFLRACAHEALARAAFVQGGDTTGSALATHVRILARAIVDAEERELAYADLESLATR